VVGLMPFPYSKYRQGVFAVTSAALAVEGIGIADNWIRAIMMMLAAHFVFALRGLENVRVVLGKLAFAQHG